MKYSTNHVLLLFFLLTPFLSTTTVSAAEKDAAKPRLVLMPIRASEDLKKIETAMESSLIEGLEKKYEIFAGERVRQKSKDIFARESGAANVANRSCDGTRCLQDIAASFQAELIATATVSKDAEGYILTLTISNIFDEKTIYSKSVPCKNCGNFQIIVKLKELTGLKATAETEHNKWSFGAGVTRNNGGSGYALKLDYDLSNLVDLPVRLRLGGGGLYDQIKTGSGLINGELVGRETNIYYLLANYYFNQNGLNFHPFIGGGIGSLKITDSCFQTGGNNVPCPGNQPATTVAMLVAGIAYDFSSTFGMEFSILNNGGGQNYGIYFKF